MWHSTETSLICTLRKIFSKCLLKCYEHTIKRDKELWCFKPIALHRWLKIWFHTAHTPLADVSHKHPRRWRCATAVLKWSPGLSGISKWLPAFLRLILFGAFLQPVISYMEIAFTVFTTYWSGSCSFEVFWSEKNHFSFLYCNFSTIVLIIKNTFFVRLSDFIYKIDSKLRIYIFLFDLKM